MNLGRNPRIRLALFGALVAIMTLTGLWNGSPVWAQEPSPAPPPPNTSFNLQYLLLQDSPGGSAVISDGSGTVLGTGDFHARVTYSRSGRTDGDVIIDFTTIFTDPLPVSLEVGFTALDELLYQDGDPVGVILSGRGMAFREGRSEAFAARVTVRGDLTNTASQPLTWDFGDNPVTPGLRADAWGRVKVQFHWDPAASTEG